MKFAKRISLFFIMPVGMFALGFYCDMKLQEEFYPNKYEHRSERQMEEQAALTGEAQVIPAAVREEEVICADTQYVIEEVDLQKNTSVETKWKVPDRYIGMDRETFVKEMELYEQSPSLKDQELGFVSADVVSFSKTKVVVRKNYMFQEISTSFYLVNQKNFVVVYCDDLRTIYMNTNITLDSLPDTLKQEIIQNKYIATEEELYNFLESYSS